MNIYIKKKERSHALCYHYYYRGYYRIPVFMYQVGIFVLLIPIIRPRYNIIISAWSIYLVETRGRKYLFLSTTKHYNILPTTILLLFFCWTNFFHSMFTFVFYCSSDIIFIGTKINTTLFIGTYTHYYTIHITTNTKI